MLAIAHMIIRPHILAIAGLASLVFGWLFSGAFHPIFPALVMADWFVVNLLNRAVDLAEDARNGVPGTAFLSKHTRAVTAATIAFLLAVLAVGHVLLPTVTAIRVVFHAIGFAYNYRIIPSPRGRTRFKEMYALKNSSSALLFVLSVILLPLYGSGHGDDGTAWTRVPWLVLFFFPLELTYEVLYDLRDVEGDAQEKVPTFPVVHGERWSYAFCFTAIAISLLAPVVGFALGHLRIREAVLCAGAIQQALVFLYVRRHGATGPRVVNVTYLGAAQLASYCIWIALGLPVFDA